MIKTRIVLTVQGGLIVEVRSNRPGVECLILDRDTDGVDEERIQEFQSGGETFRARVESPAVEHKAVTVDSLFNQAAI